MARKRVALQYALVDRAWQKGQETYTVVWGPRIESARRYGADWRAPGNGGTSLPVRLSASWRQSISCWSANGLRRKPRAPAFSTRLRRPSSRDAVMIMTGIVLPSAISRSCRSAPLMPGIPEVGNEAGRVAGSA